jgi:type II secretory pathway pseudopilin PulG
MLAMSRGDTIIEVILGITVFSLVSVGAITIMNQGSNAAQRALEITHVRQEVDAQAEAIRAAQQAATSNAGGGSAWNAIIGASTTPHYFDQPGHEATCPASASVLPSGSFVMDTRTASKVGGNWLGDISDSGSPLYAQMTYGASPLSYGLWVERDFEPVKNVNIPAIYGFTINACWYGAGLSHPLRIQSVVRLYDPTS